MDLKYKNKKTRKQFKKTKKGKQNKLHFPMYCPRVKSDSKEGWMDATQVVLDLQ